jgi:hypothetical protein
MYRYRCTGRYIKGKERKCVFSKIAPLDFMDFYGTNAYNLQCPLSPHPTPNT